MTQILTKEARVSKEDTLQQERIIASCQKTLILNVKSDFTYVTELKLYYFRNGTIYGEVLKLIVCPYGKMRKKKKYDDGCRDHVFWEVMPYNLVDAYHCFRRNMLLLTAVLVPGTSRFLRNLINLLTPTGHVMHQLFNIQQLYVLPTLYLCVLYLSENKQRLVPLTA